MSKRTDSHTISHAESIYSGDAYQAGAEGNGRGIPRASLVQVSLGTPALAVTAGLGSQDSGAGGPYPFDLTIDGSLASGGLGTFDVPRGVQVVSIGADTGTAVFVFYGTDKYGVEIQESVTSNGTTIVFGKKAFKTVTRVSVSADTTAIYEFGSSDILGLPFRLENVADILVINENDQNVYQVTGQTAGNPAAITGLVPESQGSGAMSATPAAATGAVSTVVPVITWSSGEPSAADGTITISNGASVTDAETGLWIQEMETFGLQVNADLDDHKAQIDLLVLENADAVDQIDFLVLESTDYKDTLDKIIADVLAIRNEVVKLVTDAAAVDTGTLVKADATVTATATTGDVRGTYNPTMALDGAKALKLTYKPKGRNTRAAYGSVQYRA